MKIPQLLRMCQHLLDHMGVQGATARGIAVPLALGELVEIAPGQAIAHQGEAVQELALVIQGSVDHHCEDPSGAELVVRTQEAPFIEGARSILERSPRTTTARVSGSRPAKVIFLPSDLVEDLFGRSDEVGRSLRRLLGSSLCEKIQAMTSLPDTRRDDQAQPSGTRPRPAEPAEPLEPAELSELAPLVEDWDIDVDALEQMSIVPQVRPLSFRRR